MGTDQLMANWSDAGTASAGPLACSRMHGHGACSRMHGMAPAAACTAMAAKARPAYAY